MRKIAFGCLRGSSERTEACVSLAGALAARGFDTLIVDADVHGRCAASLGVIPPRGLADLIEGSATLDDVTFQARRHLWMIFGGPELADADRLVAEREEAPSAALARALEGLRGYDYVLIDTPPMQSPLHLACLSFADELVVPVDRHVLSSAELPEFNRAVERVRGYRPELRIRCIVPHMEGNYGRERGTAKRQGFYQLMTLDAARAVDPATAAPLRSPPRQRAH